MSSGKCLESCTRHRAKYFYFGFFLPVVNADIPSHLINMQKVRLRSLWHVGESTEDDSRKHKHEDFC